MPVVQADTVPWWELIVGLGGDGARSSFEYGLRAV